MLAALYDALGDLDACFRAAEELIDLHSARTFWIASPAYGNLHRHPRYGELLHRMKLDRAAVSAVSA
jgi:hypothetical protein